MNNIKISFVLAFPITLLTSLAFADDYALPKDTRGYWKDFSSGENPQSPDESHRIAEARYRSASEKNKKLILNRTTGETCIGWIDEISPDFLTVFDGGNNRFLVFRFTTSPN